MSYLPANQYCAQSRSTNVRNWFSLNLTLERNIEVRQEYGELDSKINNCCFAVYLNAALLLLEISQLSTQLLRNIGQDHTKSLLRDKGGKPILYVWLLLK